MKLGIFSPEIDSKNVSELFEKMKSYGFQETQFDFLSICDEEMPKVIPDEWVNEIIKQSNNNGIRIIAVNGTFNMAHPDKAVRDDGVERFEKIAAICQPFSCKLVTLCTGSRNRESMWLPHPDNNLKEAWNDMIDVMENVIQIAEKYDIQLGLEIEASNVGNTPQKMKRLIDDMQTDRLKVIMDCANLFQEGMAKQENVQRLIGEAFDILGEQVILAHGKDILAGDGLDFTGAGKGIVDFDFFFKELEKIGYSNGIVLHGIKKKDDIPSCVEFIRKKSNNF